MHLSAIEKKPPQIQQPNLVTLVQLLSKALECALLILCNFREIMHYSLQKPATWKMQEKVVLASDKHFLVSNAFEVCN
jgi:hypothetical protein